MKSIVATVKGLAALVVAWMTYINDAFSPLFWVLMLLVFIDVVLNVHKEGQQFSKLGSMALSLGVPTYITSNMGNPELGKYLVAIMCLCYLQLVVPQLCQVIDRFSFSKDKQTNVIDQKMVLELLQKMTDQASKKVESSLPEEMKSVGIGPQTTNSNEPKDGGA